MERKLKRQTICILIVVLLKTFGKRLRSMFHLTLMILLLDLPTIAFNAYTHELLSISLIICVAKYIIFMLRNIKCIPQFCYCMELIYVINETECISKNG